MKNLLFVLFLLPLISNAQLMIEGTSPNLYIVHKTAAKESFYSIGRLYNISPKEIAPYNKLVLEKGLSIDQVIKIPLTSANFSQSLSAAADEALIPVYYAVKPKETLLHISAVNNKTSIADLKSWNRLKSDAVAPGAKLVVGYLKVKKELSVLASKGVKSLPVDKPIDVVEHALDKPTTDDVPKASVSTTITKKDLPVSEPVQPRNTTVSTSTKSTEGFFKTLFLTQTAQKNLKEETGTAGTFKSTSGWEDSKYYCLYNAVPAGTIVKITANHVTVYAKVLDIMPDLKQNEGMVIRISSAAAAALGITDNKFECSLNY